MKVYGFTDFLHGEQARLIVAAKSVAEVGRIVRAAGMPRSDYTLRLYGSWTSNPEEVRIATAEPGVLFAGALNGRPEDGYRRVS